MFSIRKSLHSKEKRRKKKYMEDVKANLSHTWRLLMHRKILFVWMLFAILGNILQAIFLRKTGISLPKYSYFILWSTELPFTAILWGIFGFLYFTGRVTRENCQVSYKELTIMGTLVAFNGIFMVFANSHVPGTLQSLLGPAIVTIPLSMIFSFVYLKKKFRVPQLFAAVIIFIGLVISIVPDIQKDDFSNVPKNDIPQIFWDLIFFMGSAPLAMSSVIQEDIFKKEDASVAFIMAGFIIPQGIVIWAMGPLDFIPSFGSSTPSTFFPNQADAVKCAFGISIGDACPTCRCDVAPTMYWFFVVGYIMANFANVAVVKYGSATLLYIVISITAPLCTILFSMDAVMTPFPSERHNETTWIALAVIVVGVVGYTLFDKPPGEESTLHLQEKEVLVTEEASNQSMGSAPPLFTAT